MKWTAILISGTVVAGLAVFSYLAFARSQRIERGDKPQQVDADSSTRREKSEPAPKRGIAVPFITIAQAEMGGPEEPVQQAITSKEQWQAAWKRIVHFNRRTLIEPVEKPLPEVDFTKQTVVFLARGKAIGPFNEISVARIEKDGDGVIVYYRAPGRPPGVLGDPGERRAYHVIRFEKPKGGVKFVKEE
jgi:hypothetical protein